MATRKNRVNIGGGWAINPFGLGTLCDEPIDPATNSGVTGATGGGATPATQTPAAGGTTPAGQQSVEPSAAFTAAQLQSIVEPVQTAVRQTVQAELQTVNQAVTEIQTGMTDLQKWRAEITAAADALGNQNTPIHNQAAQLFGGAPGVRIGEDPLTSRGFSITRLIGLRQGMISADQCKPELEISQMLVDQYDRGGFDRADPNSVLVPLGISMLPSDVIVEGGFTPTQLQGIRQCMAAGTENIDPDQLQWVAQQLNLSGGVFKTGNQALSQFDDTGLGNFLGETSKGELIELLRANEVFTRVGATQFTLPPNGRIQFDKHTGAVTAFWVGEVPSDKSSPLITASEPTTGMLTLLAKKLAVLVKLPNELIRFASTGIEAFIRADMARTMALKADLAMLEGVGGTSIKGIITYGGISERQPGTEAANGDTLEPEDIALAKADIEENEHDTENSGFFWAMRPRMFANLRNRRADSVSASDSRGNWLFPINRDDIGNGTPPRLDGDPVIKSTQISNTRSKGASSDLTYLLYGVARHWMIGRAGVIEFANSVQGDTAFQTDQTWVRAIQHIDAGPRYENAFGLMDTVDLDLPA